MKRPQHTKRSWLRRWLYNRFQEFMTAYQQSRAWNTRRCPCCQQPAASPDARFCAACGWLLDAHGTPTTELLPIAPVGADVSRTPRPTGYLIKQVNDALRDGDTIKTSIARATSGRRPA